MMITVDDAIAAGKTHMLVHCAQCRLWKEVPWRDLKGVMGTDRLLDVKARMICRKCGTRPVSENVQPKCQADAGGYY